MNCKIKNKVKEHGDNFTKHFIIKYQLDIGIAKLIRHIYLYML